MNVYVPSPARKTQSTALLKSIAFGVFCGLLLLIPIVGLCNGWESLIPDNPWKPKQVWVNDPNANVLVARIARAAPQPVLSREDEPSHSPDAIKTVLVVVLCCFLPLGLPSILARNGNRTVGQWVAKAGASALMALLCLFVIASYSRSPSPNPSLIELFVFAFFGFMFWTVGCLTAAGSVPKPEKRRRRKRV